MKFRILFISMLIIPLFCFAYQKRDLLQTTFDSAYTVNAIFPDQQWAPYPEYIDRAGWDTFMGVLKSEIIASGEKALDYGWNCTDTTALRGIPTYESLGLYLYADSGEAKVRYRLVNGEWQAGFPLVYDGRAIPEVTMDNNGANHRGSLVHLTPNTSYEVQVLLDSLLYCGTFRTLNDNFPVAQIIPIGNRTTPLNITQGGTANGYIVYEGGSVTVGENIAVGISINANYVIVRNTKVSGPQCGIRIEQDRHDVVIEGSEITNWGKINTLDAGRLGSSSQYWGYADGGIHISNNACRITIQRNKIHAPRTDSNTWGEYAEKFYTCISKPNSKERCHPNGPRGIRVNRPDYGTQRIFRYNTIAGNSVHMLEDALQFDGSDSDIYGNYLTGYVDDGCETDGQMRNVRIWGNHVHVISADGEAPKESVGSIFSFQPIRIGPTYSWRNLATTAGLIKAMTVKKQTRDDNALKSQEPHAGRLYYFHNTSRAGGSISGSGFKINNVYAYNNVLATGGFSGGGVNYEFDYNLYTGDSPSQPHGLKNTPQFDSKSILRVGSPGVNAGVILPNFNDNYTGIAPDMGYQEAGGAALHVGYTASYIYGDVTTNDEITAYDAEIALQYSVGISPDEFPIPWAIWRIEICDVDNDNGITANDASLILKHTEGIVNSLPVAKNSGATNDTIVSITNEDGFIVFRATGDLFGLNVFVNENAEYLGTPEILDTMMISETNISANSYAIGMATAYAPKSGDIFMRIPYSGGQNLRFTFDMIVNSKNMQVIVDLATGLTEIRENTIFVYPNPAKSSLFANGFSESTMISIYDSSGRVLKNEQVINNQIDISNFQPGIYSIKIENENGIVTKQFVIQ